MPELQIGQIIPTDTPTFEVTSSPQNPLPPGKMVFQLVVVDNNGNESLPVTMDVIVRDTERPTAVLKGPSMVQPGQPILLDGRGSTDIGGRIVQYRWTRLS
jgi:hypothetical protein